MDDYRRFCEFCGVLKSAGIDFEIFHMLPGKLLQVTRFAPDCLILDTDIGPLALWIHHGQEVIVASQNLMLQVMQKHGNRNFLYPIPLSDNRTYAPLDGRRWFYITPWPDTRRFFFQNPNHLSALVDLLLDFRKTMDESGVGLGIPPRIEKNNLLHKFLGIIDSLNSFALLAKYRLKPTHFDSLFLQYYSEAVLQTKQAYIQLMESDYLCMLANISLKDRAIKRLVRNNLRISMENQVICLRCNDYCMDLPIVDLGTLLAKAGRSMHWSYEWVEGILSRYQQEYPLSQVERKVILAFLTCPWNFYRLAARYYYNRTAWSTGTYIERMERVIAGEPYRIDLLTNLEREFK